MEEAFLYKGEIATPSFLECLLLMNKKKGVISTEGRNPVMEKARSLASLAMTRRTPPLPLPAFLRIVEALVW